MIRAGLAGLCVLAGALAATAAPVEHVSTNGRVTVALDGEGRVTCFSWPGPGAGQHLGQPGAHWSLGEFVAREELTAVKWHVEQEYQAADSWGGVTRFTEREGGRSAEQTVAAVRDMDLVIVRLRLHGFASDIPCYWVQTVEPFALRPTGIAALQPRIRALNRFASGFSTKAGMLEHFGLAPAGQTATAVARAWEDRGSSVDTGPGVYVGAVSPNEIKDGTIYPVASPAEEWKVGTPFPGVGRMVGHGTGSMRLLPEVTDGAQEFVVYLGASNTRTGLRALLSEGVKQGTGALEADRTDSGDATFQRARLNLMACLDPESGGVLRAPALTSSATYCDVAVTAWASAALDELGHPDRAAQALAVHVATLRTERGVDTPAGSLPRMIYSDGTAASVRGNADPESAAWLLAACWRHTAALAVPERRGFLEPHWSALSRCADYLAREPRVSSALSGALPAEAAPLDTLRVHYLGLESGRRMAEALGQEAPGLWTDRRDEIYARLRFRTLNQSDGDESVSPWVDWWILQLPGAKSESGAGWAVLKSEGAPALTDEAIVERTLEEGLGLEAPLALRDALRCLISGVEGHGRGDVQ